MHKHIYTHTCIYRVDIAIRTYTDVHTCTRTHIHKCTYTHAHMHTQS
jgi:hypothetical protein